MNDAGAMVVPYRLSIPDAVLEDLRRRLQCTRWPDAPAGSAWQLGADIAYLKELVAYWLERFRWRDQEALLNRLPQFTTDIDNQSHHFVHVRSTRPDATPLLLVHGWPGSFVEFLDVIDPLSSPNPIDGLETPAFHLVVPSLPGHTLSGSATQGGWNPRKTARAYADLMHRLGYDSYIAQGGDWGAFVIDELALIDAAHMKGLHTNLPIAAPPAAQITLSDQETADIEAMMRWHNEESAYALLQGTKPQTLSVGLNDSPAGLLSWVVEKFHSWSDNGLDRTIDRDRLLTNVILYWVSGTIASAARYYYYFYHMGETGFDPAAWMHLPGPITVPTAVARFPGESVRIPKPWIERRYNLKRWTVMPRGGHFAALEEPALLIEDLRAFATMLR